MENKKKRRDKKQGRQRRGRRRCLLLRDVAVYNISIMIAAGFIRDALVTTHGVIETLESHV